MKPLQGKPLAGFEIVFVRKGGRPYGKASFVPSMSTFCKSFSAILISSFVQELASCNVIAVRPKRLAKCIVGIAIPKKCGRHFMRKFSGISGQKTNSL